MQQPPHLKLAWRQLWMLTLLELLLLMCCLRSLVSCGVRRAYFAWVVQPPLPAFNCGEKPGACAGTGRRIAADSSRRRALERSKTISCSLHE